MVRIAIITRGNFPEMAIFTDDPETKVVIVENEQKEDEAFDDEIENMLTAEPKQIEPVEPHIRNGEPIFDRTAIRQVYDRYEKDGRAQRLKNIHEKIEALKMEQQALLADEDNANWKPIETTVPDPTGDEESEI